MFNYLKFLFSKKYPTGLIEDPRLEEEKALDYLHEEIASAGAPVYKPNKDNLNHYPDENQNQTSSCVAHGSTLSMTTGTPRLSKMFFYRNRMNYPAEGMWLQDAGDIAKKLGSCLYDTLPNVNYESQANAIDLSDFQINEAKQHRVDSYIQLQNPNNIDSIASIVSPETPVAIIFYASYREWAQTYPDTYDNTPFMTAPVRHCVAVVDAFKENGKKYLKIQDSAWFGGLNVRYLSEEFIQKRVYGAMYFKDLAPVPGPVKPVHVFNQNLRVGDNNQEVVWLQKRLMYEGTFPTTQTPTGYFGGITLKAVKEYQAQHNIPNTGFFGPMTRARINIA